jgi:hypothetical protein
MSTPDFEFLTTKVLGVLEKHPGGMLIGELREAINRPNASIKNTLVKLRARGHVEMIYIAQYVFLYKFVSDIDRTGQAIDRAPSIINTPKFQRPVETPRVMIRDTLPRKRQKSHSGTGIITPPRMPQPFKPLTGRNFFEAQRLAELTR